MIYYDRTKNKYYIVRCPFCGDFQHVTRNGRQYNGIYRYKCPSCMVSFQDKYITYGINLRQYLNLPSDIQSTPYRVSTRLTNY